MSLHHLGEHLNQPLLHLASQHAACAVLLRHADRCTGDPKHSQLTAFEPIFDAQSYLHQTPQGIECDKALLASTQVEIEQTSLRPHRRTDASHDKLYILIATLLTGYVNSIVVEFAASINNIRVANIPRYTLVNCAMVSDELQRKA